MKKIMSVFLVVVVLALISVIPASANSTRQFPEVELKYYDRVIEYISNENYTPNPIEYNELQYYASETDEEPDWILIGCIVDLDLSLEKHGVYVGDRLLWTMDGMGSIKFPSGYVVYLPETDEFISLTQANVDQVIERCPEFIETLEKYEIGQVRGDINEDNKIDVFDATYIQRVVADMYDYVTIVKVYEEDTFSSYMYDSIADFDKDSEVSVMDATAIQRHIAGLE